MRYLFIILLLSCHRFTPQISQQATLLDFRKQLRSGYIVRLVNDCGDTITATYNHPGKLVRGDKFTIDFDTNNVNKQGIAVRIKKNN